MQITAFINKYYDIIHKSDEVTLETAQEFVLLSEKKSYEIVNNLFINLYATSKDQVLVEFIPEMQQIKKEEHPSTLWIKESIPVYGCGLKMEPLCKDPKAARLYTAAFNSAIQINRLVRDFLQAEDLEREKELEIEFVESMCQVYAIQAIQNSYFDKDANFLENLDFPMPKMLSAFTNSLIQSRKAAEKTFALSVHFDGELLSESKDFRAFFKNRKTVFLCPKEAPAIRLNRKIYQAEEHLSAMIGNLDPGLFLQAMERATKRLEFLFLRMFDKNNLEYTEIVSKKFEQ